MKRLDITIPSEGEQLAAWLYLPESTKPAPVIVMAHGLGAVRTMRLDAFAEKYCEQGYACLVFDYRFFGDSSGEPRQLLNVKKQLEDWANAVKFAQQEKRVDTSKVIVWGSSFSGGHALATAASVPGIAGSMSQCPFTNGLASTLALNPISSIKVSTLGFFDIITSPFKKTPIMVDLAGKPGSAALMCAHDALTGYEAIKPSNHRIPGYVAARFAYDIIRYFPGQSAAKVTCPALIIACLKDTVAPVKPTLKYAKQLAQGKLVEFDTGHFDIYVGEWFEQTVAVQIAWLKQHFPIKG
ncbi:MULTISPECIES: alpha/beta hydrolase [Thalassolituus]|jgi:dienelactone hydrolase|uniref:Dienelactone hydrolase-like enzyme n=1 Tax=Thalassolituus oleivorans MIL-1 TaxID=1298593 RepID=M5DUD1_9GAMM|nr:alpha/beta fold hydrolase [Thalassolituus oleivorans]PCI50707.1 MAG: alpha/beta hydrolase [Oceanospirillales bacterium]CCU73002.1 dienelactone hydrolase-like enzyme [Thalassolituus oleivorans MIL-1]|tara:strand:- start:5635 stop:6525 length:891 start_codon:yes stop_codon:yes gene_type:complete